MAHAYLVWHKWIKNVAKNVYGVNRELGGLGGELERLRFTFTPNSKQEFVSRDQLFPLIVVYCLLLVLKNK